MRLVTWIDANAPYHDRVVNKRPAHPSYSLPDDQELLSQISAIHSRRCGACHQPEAITRADWVNLHASEKSLFLTAPLGEKCGNAYADPNDPDYQLVLNLVQDAVKKSWHAPRRDLEKGDGLAY